MAGYSDLELKYARPVAQAILERPDFRVWILAGTKYAADAQGALPVGDAQGHLRNHPLKNPYWFNCFCGRDSRCACRIGNGIETDILLLLDLANGRRFALHIEIKRPGEKLGDGQAESYPRRAACWTHPATRPRTVLAHQEYLTMLICGSELERDEGLRHFDKVVFHEDVSENIAIYPEN